MQRCLYSPSLPDAIRDAIRNVEKRARARFLNPTDVEKILDALHNSPAGYACADGGAVANSTYLYICWYSRRDKHVLWNVSRISASQAKWGRAPSCEIDLGLCGREHAYRCLFPERYDRLVHLKSMRQLKLLGIAVPDGILISVVDVNERFRLALVIVKEKGEHLCTPVGCFLVSPWRKHLTVSGAAQEIVNQSLPCSPKAAWEDIEPLFIMAALKK